MKIENKKAYIPCEIVGNQINNGLDIRVRIDKTHDLYINRKLLIHDIDQPKPVVPQFVAEWYEEHKEDLEYDLYLYQMSIYDLKPKKDDFYYWMEKTNNPVRKLINMHQFGYTVEKKKLYQIIDKRLNATFSCLGYDIEGRAWFWGNKKFFKKNKGVRLAHTRQQLIDAGFEEVFENPNYEVKEVME